MGMELLRLLHDFNPWWKEDVLPFERDLPHRKSYAQLEKGLDTRQILALTGLRRTGKSTIAKQLLAKLLIKDKIPSKRCCYFLFDEAPNTKPEMLEEVIRTFVENICNEQVGYPKERIYIFLDELQYIENWSAIIKRFYDISPNYKFIITGSASLFISKKVSESLAGRIFEYKIRPLDFEEYLLLSKKKTYNFYSLEEIVASSMRDIKNTLITESTRILPVFADFLQKGQFPELILLDDTQLVRQYLNESIIKKIIYSDLPRLFNIENIEDLNIIFKSMVRDTGNVLEYQNLARETAISESTVKRYISHLKDAFLVDLVYNFTKKERQSRRQLKKGYVASTNFTATNYHWDDKVQIPSEILGHLVETYVFNLLSSSFDKISFMNQQGREIDFIVDKFENRFLIEVKYQNRITKKDVNFLVSKMTKNSEGIVFTKNIIDEIDIDNKKIKLIPAWAIK